MRGQVEESVKPWRRTIPMTPRYYEVTFEDERWRLWNREGRPGPLYGPERDRYVGDFGHRWAAILTAYLLLWA